MSGTVAEVAEAKYVMLTTYKKDGTAVASPLWAARSGDDMMLWTLADSWKVKRLRRNGAVLVQACDARGAKTFGPQVEGVGEVIDADPAVDAVVAKYGLIGRITVWGSYLRRGKSASIGLRIVDKA